jgi:ATPase subunit of ABC transporter with duplicated ATPase domains
VGHVELSHLDVVLPDGRPLLRDVSFRVGSGARAALVGPNGAGKSTLLRIIAGHEMPAAGRASHSGGLGVMPQFVGSHRPGEQRRTVRDLLLDVAPAPVAAAGRELDAAELALMDTDDTPTQLRYAQALADWTEVRGHDTEVLWDTCTTLALGQPYEQARWRWLTECSGGEQKRLVLEALLRGPDEVLLLDEPDNYLDVPAKRWLEQRLLETSKTVLFVSHDRELLGRVAGTIVTVEAGEAWVHGGGFDGYAQARKERSLRRAALVADWNEEHHRLQELVLTLRQQAAIGSDLTSRYRAMQHRLQRFEEAGPPPAPPPEQNVRMRLGGGRTGEQVVIAQRLELTGLTLAFDLGIYYGERVALLGANGSGKSHLLRLLAGDSRVAHTGSWRLGARVVPGLFAQTHEHPELSGRTLADVVAEVLSTHDRGPVVSALRRYELDGSIDQRFDSLSGGQQARLQVLLLELAGTTLLLLDEPTDNLDLASAEALQAGLEAYRGTVLAVTHDRWFARSFGRFLVLGSDGSVRQSSQPLWEEARPGRPPR